jgi:hypothetical protein
MSCKASAIISSLIVHHTRTHTHKHTQTHTYTHIHTLKSLLFGQVNLVMLANALITADLCSKEEAEAQLLSYSKVRVSLQCAHMLKQGWGGMRIHATSLHQVIFMHTN